MANHKGPQKKAGSNKSPIVAKLPAACTDERHAVEFMEEQRWGDEPSCAKCGVVGECYQMADATTGKRNKRFLWRCRACKQQYTVKVGTIMEGSAIPIQHWCYAFWAACASKKGISALQIRRMTGVSYKSALFMMHRIRFAMAPTDSPKLRGIVEVDETYVGGKPRKKAEARVVDGEEYGRRRGPAPDFKDRKTPVVAGIERGGRVRACVVPDVTGENLERAVFDAVEKSARLMTDERIAYQAIGREFASHDTVNHSAGEYVRGEAHINTAEGFFSLLKRGVVGTFHAVSKKHLHRYVSEFEFRYNLRMTDDGERIAQAIKAANGKRLTYADQVGR